MSVHTDLIDAVNDAKTQREHDIAEARLDGWRSGIAYAGKAMGLLFIDADHHSMERFGEDRPMCAGVLLDWTPS